MTKIKVIFFDLDDTLVNSRKAEKDASICFKNMFSELNGINDNNFSDLWHKIAAEQYEKYAKGEKTFERQRIDRVKECFIKFGVEKSDEEAKEIYKINGEEWKCIEMVL